MVTMMKKLCSAFVSYCQSSILGRGINYFLRQYIKTSPRFHPVSYLVLVGGSLSVCKAKGLWWWPPCTLEAKNTWTYASVPPYVFMAWGLNKGRECFTLWGLRFSLQWLCVTLCSLITCLQTFRRNELHSLASSRKCNLHVPSKRL